MVIRQTQTFGENWVIDKRIIKIQGEKDMVSSFENKLKNSNFLEKKDYFVSDEGYEGKVYTVVSHQLKKVICEVVNPLLRINEWEVKEEEFVVKIEDYYRKGSSKITNDRWLSDEEAKAMKTRDMEKAGKKKIEFNNSIQNNYNNWSREQLISEINCLKVENEELKNSQNLTTLERQSRLQQNQRRLEKLESVMNISSSQPTSKPSNNSLSTPLLIGGGILVVIGLVMVSCLWRKTSKAKYNK